MVGLLYDPTQPLSLIEMVNNPAWMGVKPTLGQRNNNWGNLRTTDAFEGKTGTNKSYDTYETPEKGLRALARVLDTYSSKHGINTIDALVNRYAPASDNTGGSHENYKTFIAQQLGIGINDPIDVKAMRPQLMDAIIRFENKNRPLASSEMLNQAIMDADGTHSQDTNKMAQIAYYDRDGVPRDKEGRVVVNITPNAPPNAGALSGSFGDESYSPEQQAILSNIQQTAQQSMNQAPAALSGDPSLDEAASFDTTPPPPPMNTVPDNDPALLAAMQQPQSGGVLTTPANAGTVSGTTGNYSTAISPPPPPSSPVSGNRRDQSQMSFPPQTTNMYDALIRIGGAGVGASAKGGLSAFEAMTKEYGRIQDADAKNALEAYKTAISGQNKSAKAFRENQAQIGQIDQTVFDMDHALANLKSGMSLTGWWDSTVGKAWDNFKGNPEAAARLLLQKLKVDDALLRVAQTKGSISNAEMKLFLQPAPSDMSDEKVWIKWLEDRKTAAQAIRQRLATGETVDPSQQASTSQINTFGSSQTVVSPNVAAARKALTQ